VVNAHSRRGGGVKLMAGGYGTSRTKSCSLVAETSAQLSNLVDAHSRGASTAAGGNPGGGDPSARGSGNEGGGAGSPLQGNKALSDADLDTDLEAYLQARNSSARRSGMGNGKVCVWGGGGYQCKGWSCKA